MSGVSLCQLPQKWLQTEENCTIKSVIVHLAKYYLDDKIRQNKVGHKTQTAAKRSIFVEKIKAEHLQGIGIEGRITLE
jgi:hypothetical protein